LITARPAGNEVPWFVSLLVSWLPFIALIGVWIFLAQRIKGTTVKANRPSDEIDDLQRQIDELRKRLDRIDKDKRGS
jgi:ATP-dependent Zn protease